MQIIQIPRGNISVRMNSLPLLQGEYFFDTGTAGKDFADAALFIGTGTKNNSEWSPTNVTGGYLKVGGTGGLNIAGHITDFPENHGKLGDIWIVDNDIQVPEGQIFGVTGDGITSDSDPELKRGDFLIDTGDGWLRVNNSGGAAAETKFYSNLSNAVQGTTNVQEAIYALDSNKLSYGGDLVVSKGATYTLGQTKTAVLTNENTEGTNASINEEWANIQGSFFRVTEECSITDNDGNTITFEQGDFVAFTTNKDWKTRGVDVNEKHLLGATIKVTKIPGGTHDPSKLYLTNETLQRAAPGDRVYDTEDRDQKISNVKEALEVLYGTKADLDPSTGKILLNELPETIIGAMDYQGVISEPHVPTAADKAENRDNPNKDRDTDEDPDTTAQIVKGDYWIYSGDTWTLSEDDLASISKTGKKDADGNYTINKGDWLVYNGTVFDVIDNTAEFIGIKVDGNEVTLQGIVTFKGSTRTHNGESYDELQAVQDNTTNSVQYKSENAILDVTDTPKNSIYRSDGDKVAKASNLVDDDETLTITESEGIVLKSDAENTIHHEIKHGTGSAEVALPNKNGTLAIDEDIGVGEATNPGTDWTVAMYDTENDRKVLKDSFLKFLAKASGQLKGFELKDGNSRDVEIRLSSRTTKTVQVLPVLSGYILNSNSIIDCGVWDAAHPQGYTPNEGHGVINSTTYKPASGEGDDLSILGAESNGNINTVTYDISNEETYPEEEIEAIITDGTGYTPEESGSGSSTPITPKLDPYLTD